MRIRLVLLGMLIAANAFAVAPQFWRVQSAEDFLAGDVDGFAVTARGQLRPAPDLHKIASFTDPFVLSQVDGARGDRFFGTGNEGKVYRLRGGDLKAIFTAPEPEVYALLFQGGSLYAATSPNGKVFRIDPESGKATVFFDPKQAYIWALAAAPGGDILVGTGVEGKLFRVTPSGAGTVLFTAPETHVRSLAVRKDGSVLAGGSGKGRIYEVRADGAAHALFDSPMTEMASIYASPSGTAWAAASSSTSPSSVPAARPAKPASGAAASGSTATADTKGDRDASVTPTPSVSVSLDTTPSSGDGAPAGSGEVDRIDPDGFAQTVHKFERELVYAIGPSPDGGILIATGPQGRIYSYKDGELALIATVPEKQIVSMSASAGAIDVTTTNTGAVYRLEGGANAKAEYRSSVKDADRFSRFGHYQIDGTDIGGDRVAIAFRSGNTRTPDATWSSWSAPSPAPAGSVNAPAARFLQWRLTTPKPSPATMIESVSVGFVNRNVAPQVDAVTVADPAVIFISGSYPASPQVVEASNPDEYGIFTSIDTARDKAEPGKKVFRKGYRTILWRAHDDNGDSLRYSVMFRRQGSDKWLRLRDRIDESQINFDTSQLPDGWYEIRVTATDEPDNPDAPLTDAKEGVRMSVDNTPPTISASTAGDTITIHVHDALSPVGKVEYSADAQKWIRMTPADGIADSPDETYTLPRSAITGKFIVVRAVDAFYNVATASVP